MNHHMHMHVSNSKLSWTATQHRHHSITVGTQAPDKPPRPMWELRVESGRSALPHLLCCSLLGTLSQCSLTLRGAMCVRAEDEQAGRQAHKAGRQARSG